MTVAPFYSTSLQVTYAICRTFTAAHIGASTTVYHLRTGRQRMKVALR